jgi:hypothetical protein
MFVMEELPDGRKSKWNAGIFQIGGNLKLQIL